MPDITFPIAVAYVLKWGGTAAAMATLAYFAGGNMFWWLVVAVMWGDLWGHLWDSAIAKHQAKPST